MVDFEYKLFDADNHYYEPPDCFTRYIEPRQRDKAIQLKPVEGGEYRRWSVGRPRRRSSSSRSGRSSWIRL